MPAPIIGITVDAEPAGGYSKFPWFALRQNYCSAVARAGAVPVLIPHEPEQIEAYLAMIDGLLITGGAFDLDPLLFGASERHATVQTKDARTAFELALTRGALAADLPILGICGGQQLLHVVLGGRLIQHIPDEVPDALAHEQPNPRDEPGHPVQLVDGTQLRALAGISEIAVNSAHHQAAKDVPDGVVVSAFAPDGVIEAIEVPDRRFCVGVQWHPEFAISPADTALFRALVLASAGG